MTHETPPQPEPLTAKQYAEIGDGHRLRLLAAWFDMWDRPQTDRQSILNDERNPGRNDVQRDLRRIAGALDSRADAQLLAATTRDRLAALLHEQFCAEMGFGDGVFEFDHIGSSTCRERADEVLAAATLDAAVNDYDRLLRVEAAAREVDTAGRIRNLSGYPELVPALAALREALGETER